MQPVEVQLPDHTAGDTWERIHIGPILFNNAQPPESLQSCRWYFRDRKKVIGYKFKSSPGAGEGTITINDAATWDVTIPPTLMPLEKGDWHWDFETTDAAGVVRTLYHGVLKLTCDVSHD